METKEITYKSGKLKGETALRKAGNTSETDEWIKDVYQREETNKIRPKSLQDRGFTMRHPVLG